VKEAANVVEEFAAVNIPIVGVLGNHDYHANEVRELTTVLTDGGIRILDGESVTLEIRGETVGIVGAKGFGGGFGPSLLTAFGEPLVKAWVEAAAVDAAKVEEGLRGLATDYRLVVLHYSPIAETLHGERAQISPFLGCSCLAEAIDRCGADVVFHGHAHKGTAKGQTAGGIPVRNVAMHVLQRYYALFELRPVAGKRLAPAAAETTSSGGWPPRRG
jgi:Icc-related predicted phosphoesterase